MDLNTHVTDVSSAWWHFVLFLYFFLVVRTSNTENRWAGTLSASLLSSKIVLSNQHTPFLALS